MEIIGQKTDEFLEKYGINDLLKKYGKPNFYSGYKPGSSKPMQVLAAVALIRDKKDFSVILELQKELNERGFNNFRSFDNNQPGWPLYTPHVVCDAYTCEAKIGYYDQFVKPEDGGEVDITVCSEEELDKITGQDRRINQVVPYPENLGDDYLQVADDCQEKAKYFLDKYQVFELLRKYGEPEVYGSYSLGLMNRPDIDTVLVVGKKDFSIAIELQRELQAKGSTNFWVFDNSKGGSVDDPKHIIVDAYVDEWEMGITICNCDEADSVLTTTKQVEKAIESNPSLKGQILRLKSLVAQKYGVGHYPSREIYQAALEGNAKSVEDFEKYIDSKNSGR